MSVKAKSRLGLWKEDYNNVSVLILERRLLPLFRVPLCVRLLSTIACELHLDLCYFDVDQALVQSKQSKLDEDVFLRLPKGCGSLSGKIVRLNKSLYRLKQASRSWHAHFTSCLKTLGFEQYLADAWVFRLVKEGRVAIIAVVHVDDIVAVGLKSRWCDRFCDELNHLVLVKHLEEL